MQQFDDYKKSTFDTSDNVRIISILFDGAINFIKLGRIKMVERNISGKGFNIGKATAIVSELTSSLNMEEGGEIARNLRRLYDFVLDRLLKANLKNDVVCTRRSGKGPANAPGGMEGDGAEPGRHPCGAIEGFQERGDGSPGMSDRVDILLLELLDLARGQRVAVKEGDIDAAVELLEKRQGIIERIQRSGRVKRAPLSSWAWDDGNTPRPEVFWENRHPVIQEILSIDEEIRKSVKGKMSEVASGLDSLEKLACLKKTSDFLGRDNKERRIA